ncbi:hypothetical protein RFI_35033, partial [Reticulomyxa filosa]
DIAPFNAYAYVCINDTILFFGGCGSGISKLVHKYSIRENKWMTFQNTLPSPLYDCVAILSEDSTHVHIIGGKDDNYKLLSTHLKIKVSEWLTEEEMKKGIELKAEKEEEKKENEMDKTIKKENDEQQNKVKKDTDVEYCFDTDETKKKGQNENDIIFAKVNEMHVTNIFSFVFFFLHCIEKWMKWWNEREQQDKIEIIQKFETMSNEQFGVWLLNECKWKHKITKGDIASIRFSIDTYLKFIKTNQENKEEE